MFKKYPSLINHYKEKEIESFFLEYPQLKDEQFCVQEKIDGANFSIITNGYDIHFAKRSGVISVGEKFFNFKTALDDIKDELETLKQYARSVDTPIQFYGELYGRGINDRINYSPKQNIVIYDMLVGDLLMPSSMFYNVMTELKLRGLTINPIAVGRWENVINTPIKEDSEGIVIKPYNGYYVIKGQPFLVKKKAERFSEVKRINKFKPGMSQHAIHLETKFLGYLNENRVLSCLSKEGKIESNEDFSRFIKLICEDAKSDFLSDHTADFECIDDKEKKKVLALAGRVIPKLLLKHARNI